MLKSLYPLQTKKERESKMHKIPNHTPCGGEKETFATQELWGATDRNRVEHRRTQACVRIKRRRRGSLAVLWGEDLAHRLEHECRSRGCRTPFLSRGAILLNCSHIAVSASYGLYEGLIWHQTAILNPAVYHNLFTLHAKRILVFKIYRKWG